MPPRNRLTPYAEVVVLPELSSLPAEYRNLYIRPLAKPNEYGPRNQNLRATIQLTATSKDGWMRNSSKGYTIFEFEILELIASTAIRV
jgi:hypothetical protein